MSLLIPCSFLTRKNPHPVSRGDGKGLPLVEAPVKHGQALAIYEQSLAQMCWEQLSTVSVLQNRRSGLLAQTRAAPGWPGDQQHHTPGNVWDMNMIWLQLGSTEPEWGKWDAGVCRLPSDSEAHSSLRGVGIDRGQGTPANRG